MFKTNLHFEKRFIFQKPPQQAPSSAPKAAPSAQETPEQKAQDMRNALALLSTRVVSQKTRTSLLQLRQNNDLKPSQKFMSEFTKKLGYSHDSNKFKEFWKNVVKKFLESEMHPVRFDDFAEFALNTISSYYRVWGDRFERFKREDIAKQFISNSKLTVVNKQGETISNTPIVKAQLALNNLKSKISSKLNEEFQSLFNAFLTPRERVKINLSPQQFSKITDLLNKLVAFTQQNTTGNDLKKVETISKLAAFLESQTKAKRQEQSNNQPSQAVNRAITTPASQNSTEHLSAQDAEIVQKTKDTVDFLKGVPVFGGIAASIYLAIQGASPAALKKLGFEKGQLPFYDFFKKNSARVAKLVNQAKKGLKDFLEQRFPTVHDWFFLSKYAVKDKANALNSILGSTPGNDKATKIAFLQNFADKNLNLNQIKKINPTEISGVSEQDFRKFQKFIADKQASLKLPDNTTFRELFDKLNKPSTT
jgi:hypothetical protein